MICEHKEIIILVNRKISEEMYEVTYLSGNDVGLTTRSFLLYSKSGRKFTDYNEPITLQNV